MLLLYQVALKDKWVDKWTFLRIFQLIENLAIVIAFTSVLTSLQNTMPHAWKSINLSS